MSPLPCLMALQWDTGEGQCLGRGVRRESMEGSSIHTLGTGKGELYMDKPLERRPKHEEES